MDQPIYPAINPENQLTCQPICYGIDLGTTYTLFALVDSREVNLKESLRIPVKFIRFQQESPFPYDSTKNDEKVASMLAIYENKIYVGNNLYHLKGIEGFDYHKNFFYHWKVEMGVDHHPMYPEAISEKVNMPYKVAGGILNYCRLHYLNGRQEELENTIITVPASFQANQRKDTLRAAALGKIKTNNRMLIDEPNAAFLGYFNRLEKEEKQRWAQSVREKNILVIDFGGGTCDLSILTVNFDALTGIIIGNKAISRYNDLGGQDIDMIIAEEIIYPFFLEVANRTDNLSILELQEKILPQLAVWAEKLKILICDRLNLKAGSGSVESLDLENISASIDDCVIFYNNEEFKLDKISITAVQFKSLFSKIFSGKYFKFKYQDKTITTVSQSITEITEKANLTFDEISYVLFAGGSSFNPFLISMVNEKLQEAIALTSPEPDKLVVEGAAIFSYFFFNYGIELIRPIISDTIGIRIRGNKFYPLIEKGKSLPQKVSIPDFRLQTNMISEIVVPVCINDLDFEVGEIRCQLNDFYDIDDPIRIEASISEDKVFDIEVYINDNYIGMGIFENPFSSGKLSEEEREIQRLSEELNNAKLKLSRNDEKRILRELIWKHSDANNSLGSLQCAEDYIRKFDDQDSYVWNMVYCMNSNLGRQEAAKRGLDKAIQLNPNEPTFSYNYSLLLDKIESTESALEFLNNLSKRIKEDSTVKCKIILLRKDLKEEVKIEALELVELHKTRPASFSDFDKKNLLPGIYRAAGLPYSFIDPKNLHKNEDENKLIDTKD